MSKKLTVGIIGGGNMGAAILGGVRKKFNVCVAEKDQARQRFIKSTYKLATIDMADLIKRSDVFILAVKPQNFEEILQEIKGHLQKRHLIISIAAGITTTYIEKRLGKGVRVVRTMPNLPLQTAAGMTAIARGKNAASKDMEITKAIFSSVGIAIEVKEREINAITAVSGSGPAYVFNFIGCFMVAAEKVGLKTEDAILLVMQTVLGSLDLLMKTKEDPRALCKKVASKGGTTEAALKVFGDKDFQGMFIDALKAAKKRAKELSK